MKVAAAAAADVAALAATAARAANCLLGKTILDMKMNFLLTRMNALMLVEILFSDIQM